MKAVAEIFKLASRINIKPKDIIGMGGDIVKMGKSLFNTKVNPKLTEFINKKGEIPTKIVEDLKIHLRSLKNASENQVELFKLNLKDIVNAKFPPKVDVIKLPVSSSKKLATSGTELGGFSYKNNLLKEIDKKIMTEMEMSSKELYAMSDDALMSLRRNADPIRMEEYFSLEAEVFKGWTPTVIKGGKDPKFNEGGVAKLNAELNQLPEYYLPFADGGIANHFRKK